tara:strand:- start:34 stop:390 length:357 start_codon:yes stop_codon:yes gene_type:complete
MIPSVKNSNMLMIGYMIIMMMRIGEDIKQASFSGCFSAMVLGVISPKISSKTVITLVMMDMDAAMLVMPNSDNELSRTAVAVAEVATLAMLFPIKIAVSKRFGFEYIFSNRDFKISLS